MRLGDLECTLQIPKSSLDICQGVIAILDTVVNL